MQTIQPWRVAVKALILVFIANILFGLFNPPIEMLSLYNSLVHGRERFPFEDSEYEKQGNTMMLYESFDAMFASHVISKPKSADEYRVVLIGDSSVWGYNLPVSETLSARLNALNLTTCDKKRISVYNLAYVGLYLPSNLLIIDNVVKYKPDLIVWVVTLESFLSNGRINATQKLWPYANEAFNLIEKHNLQLDTYGMQLETYWDKTIWVQKSKLKKLAKFQLDGLLWEATNVDFYLRPLPKMSPDVYPDPVHKTSDTFNLLPSDLPLDVLNAGFEVASPIPVLVVNEPIYIASGKNSGVRYDSYYPRHAYAQYRTYLSDWMKKKYQPYVDLWNFVPADQFEETPLHISAVGEALVAARLAPEIMRFSCK